jgi:hypothetical protein
VAWQAGEVRLFDATGTAVLRFRPRPAGKTPDSWPLLLAEQGRELWMFEAATKNRYRFALP